MARIEKTILYFTKYGPQNTDDVLQAVLNRLNEGDVDTVIVASTTGATGLKFAKALKGLVKLIAISPENMETRNRIEILRLGGKVIEKAHLPLHKRKMSLARKSFYALGQGFKVAIETIFIATEKGMVTPYKDVISVGGTDEGSDTAIIARATTSDVAFEKYKRKKLEVREIMAMPLKKKWWY